MAEEVANSTRIVPRSLVFSLLLNGSLGFAILVVFLVSAGDLEMILESGSQFPFIDILASCLGSIGAATTLVVVLIILNICSAIGLMSSASRMIWSFSRDQAMPGWRWLRQVGLFLSQQS
jgi:choline transport protein